MQSTDSLADAAGRKLSFSEIFFAKWHPYFVVFVAVFLVYAKTIAFSFTYLDDDLLIINNIPSLNNPLNIVVSFFHGLGVFSSFYRPVFSVSLILDTLVGAGRPQIYHLSNVIIHLLASWGVLALFLRLGYQRGISLFVALLFSLHPALTQAVAWIPGRNDALMGLFLVFSFLFFVEHTQRPSFRALFLHLLLFALALFTKETAAIAPLVFALFMRFDAKKPLISRFFVRAGLGWLAITGAWLLLRYHALGGTGNLTYDFVNSGAALLQYAGKMLLPVNLSVLPISEDTVPGYGLIAIALLCVALYLSKPDRRNRLLFGVSWAVLFLLPVVFILFAQIKEIIHHEARLYVPCIGFLIIIAEAMTMAGPGRALRGLVPVAACAVILLFGGLSFARGDHFINRLTFWESAARTSPRSKLSYHNLGTAHWASGNYDDALICLQKASALMPDDFHLHYLIASAWSFKMNWEKAVDEYNRSIALNGNFAPAHCGLGISYHQLNDVASALRCFRRILALPSASPADRLLAQTYLNRYSGKTHL